MRTSSRQRAWALRTLVEQPSRMRKKCCYGQRNFGSICGSLSPSPTHLSHITNINPFTTLSRIKCERYIFIKKCVRSSLLSIMFPHIYIYVYALCSCIWLYNKKRICTYINIYIHTCVCVCVCIHEYIYIYISIYIYI